MPKKITFLKLDGELVNCINDEAQQIEEAVDTDSHRTSFLALKVNNQITSFNSQSFGHSTSFGFRIDS